MTIDNNTPLQPDQIYTSNPVPPTPLTAPSDKHGIGDCSAGPGHYQSGRLVPADLLGLPLAIAASLPAFWG